MDQSVLKKARIQHEISPEDLKRIPQELRDPLLIFDSKSTGLNIVTSLSNTRGLPVVLSLHLDQKRSGYVIHNIATASQRNIGQLQRWMDPKSTDKLHFQRVTLIILHRGPGGWGVPRFRTPHKKDVAARPAASPYLSIVHA